MGATFTNEILQWDGAKTSIVLQKYGDTLTRGIATVTLNSERDRRASEIDKAIKKGKDDL